MDQRKDIRLRSDAGAVELPDGGENDAIAEPGADDARLRPLIIDEALYRVSPGEYEADSQREREIVAIYDQFLILNDASVWYCGKRARLRIYRDQDGAALRVGRINFRVGDRVVIARYTGESTVSELQPVEVTPSTLPTGVAEPAGESRFVLLAAHYSTRVRFVGFARRVGEIRE